MKPRHPHPARRRLKAAGIALAALAGGAILLYASLTVSARARTVAGTQAAGAAPPAGAPATTPSDAPESPDPQPPGNRAAVAQSMGSMLLLLAMMALAVGLIAVGWIVYDIRRSRPKWMTQTKYPTRR